MYDAAYKNKTLSVFEKASIATEIAKGLDQLHNSVSPPLCHGRLTPKNIFIERDPEIGIRVMIGDLQMQTFLNYASTLMGYRGATAWSSPEVLENSGKQMGEPSKEQDIYSFGMILWEIFHGAAPFDGNTKLAINYVLNEDSRPMIDEEIDQ
jgi:serine/threonine protein kinase